MAKYHLRLDGGPGDKVVIDADSLERWIEAACAADLGQPGAERDLAISSPYVAKRLALLIGYDVEEWRNG